jgi:hypothetical protein
MPAFPLFSMNETFSHVDDIICVIMLIAGAWHRHVSHRPGDAAG